MRLPAFFWVTLLVVLLTGLGLVSLWLRERNSLDPYLIPAARTHVPADAHYVSATSGSDSNPGTADAPWQTLAKAASRAAPGDFIVLMPGAYGAVGTTISVSRSGSSGEPIVFTSYPGAERAVIRGYVRVTGSHLRFESLVFDGPTGAVSERSSSNPGGEDVQVSIMSDGDVELRHSEVRDNAWHAGVYVNAATDVRIAANYIHGNGDPLTGPNLDHGIYWSSGTGAITNNIIANNVAYGVQLYPNAANVAVINNTIVGQGRGGIIVAAESSGNQLVNNLVANNAWYGIRSYDLTGTGNVASNNLLWDNGENMSGMGIAFSSTIVQDPDLIGGNTFSVSSTSPAIDRGATTDVIRDYTGARRPQGAAPDIGAYEIR